MREIKFRGKRIDNGEWDYGYYSTFSTPLTGVISHCIIPNGFRPFEVDPETVGQFAEYSDGKRTEEYSKGQKVFDGDIVKWTSLNIEGEAVGEVTFFDGSWFIQGEKHNGLLNDCLTCEVIGNIHDNPDF